MFYGGFNDSDVIIRQHDFIITEIPDNILLQLIDPDRQYIIQIHDSLPDRLDPMPPKLLHRRKNSLLKSMKVGGMKECAMHNAAVRQLMQCIPADLAAVHKDIVPS